MFRAVITGLALTLGASQATAQITTYIAPPRAAAPSAQAIAAADSVQRDSVARVAVTNMKVWVDSAAGVSVPSHVGDSTAVDPGRPVTTFSDGTVAPATASSLPTVAFVGLLAFVMGIALLRHRGRA
jgi:hypothetical protein